MAALVSDSDEPIVPLVAKLDALSGIGVSAILVLGSSSAFFEHADCVIMMKGERKEKLTIRINQPPAPSDYQPRDVTARVAEIVNQQPVVGVDQVPNVSLAPRAPVASSLMPILNCKLSVDKRTITFRDVRDGIVDLSFVEQIDSAEQVRAIAYSLRVSWFIVVFFLMYVFISFLDVG